MTKHVLTCFIDHKSIFLALEISPLGHKKTTSSQFLQQKKLTHSFLLFLSNNSVFWTCFFPFSCAPVPQYMNLLRTSTWRCPCLRGWWRWDFLMFDSTTRFVFLHLLTSSYCRICQSVKCRHVADDAVEDRVESTTLELVCLCVFVRACILFYLYVIACVYLCLCFVLFFSIVWGQKLPVFWPHTSTQSWKTIPLCWTMTTSRFVFALLLRLHSACFS